MITISIPDNPRGVHLANLLTHYNIGSRWKRTGTVIEIRGRRLVVHRWMVEQVLWPESTSDPEAVDRFIRHFLRLDPRALCESTREGIVVTERPEGEQAFLVRFPAGLKARLARLAQTLSMSQNELVVRAVEDLLSFAQDFSQEPPDVAKPEPSPRAGPPAVERRDR